MEQVKEVDVENGDISIHVPSNEPARRGNSIVQALTNLPTRKGSKGTVLQEQLFFPQDLGIPEPTLLVKTRILRKTVEANDVVGARRIIARLKQDGAEKSAGFTIQDVSGNGLLQIAALRNHVKMTEVLLEMGFDINAVDSNHGTALQAAIYLDHYEILMPLLHNPKMVSSTTGGFYGSALQVAAFKGCAKVTRVLLSRPEVDVNVIGGKYGNVLQAAARSGVPSIVQMILDGGFKDVNIPGNVYGTALEAAAKGNGSKIEQHLKPLSRGKILKKPITKPHMVTRKVDSAMGNTDYLAVAEILLNRKDNNAKVNIGGGQRFGHPLNAAAASGQKAMLSLLLKKDDEQSPGGSPLRYKTIALMSAITQCVDTGSRLDLVQMLVEHGTPTDFEDVTSPYRRPLTAAAAMDCPKVLSYLLERAGSRKLEVINAESGLYGCALRAAICAASEDTALELIKQGADLTISELNHGYILHHAIFKHLNKVVSYLIDNKLVDVNAADENDQTPLHIAAYRGRVTIVEKLLSATPNVHSQDLWGDTPLAIVEGRLERDNNPGPTLEDLRRIQQLLADKACRSNGPYSMGSLNSFHGPTLFKKLSSGLSRRSGLPKPRSVYSSIDWNPGLGFKATVVDVLGNEDDLVNEVVITARVEMNDLLYRDGAVDEIMKDRGSRDEKTLRWIHIPTNNMTWAEMLLKALWKQTHGNAPCKSFWGVDPYFVSPDLAPHARFVTPQCERLIATCDDPESPSTASQTRIDPWWTLFVAMPYLHWEPYRAQQAVSELLDKLKEASLKERILRRRTLDKKDAPPWSRDGDNPLTQLGNSVQHSFQQTKPPELDDAEMTDKDDLLLYTYVSKRLPIHLRRTLDQYFYSYLVDTKSRDSDQVVMRIWDRYQQKEADDAKAYLDALAKAATPAIPTNRMGKSYIGLPQETKKKEPGYVKPQKHKPPGSTGPPAQDMNSPIVMVDQLWLWVIRKDLIVTSFAQRRSDKAEGDLDPDDRTDILKTLLSYLHSAKRQPVQDAYDLVELITSQCVGMLHRSDMIPELDFLKIFARHADSAIDEAMTRLKDFVAEYQDFMNWLNEKHRNTEQYVLWFEDIFSVTSETNLLREIQDLRDELAMLAAVFDDQNAVLKKAGECIKNDKEKVAGKKGGSFNYAQQSSKQARHLKDLLDLKQQQASVLEARVSRNQTIASQDQSKIILVFTIVTIVFLPLTFMTTVFTLPLLELPRYSPADPSVRDSGGQLKSGYVFGITVGVTAALAVPLIVSAFKIKQLEGFWHVVHETVFPLHFRTMAGFRKEKREMEARVGGEVKGPVFDWGLLYWGGPPPRRGTNIVDIDE